MMRTKMKKKTKLCTVTASPNLREHSWWGAMAPARAGTIPDV